jgi:deazaflavin-dependent oxidoreductase (nitroreductase family)
MPSPNDHNTKVIEEFRANAGVVQGWGDAKLLLLTTTGAKSGKHHTTPVAYSSDGDRLVVIASYAGRENNPAWYHNLVAHPNATVEVGAETFEAVAEVAEGAERDRIYAAQAAAIPAFAEYERKTTRRIPVILLNRVG